MPDKMYIDKVLLQALVVGLEIDNRSAPENGKQLVSVMRYNYYDFDKGPT